MRIYREYHKKWNKSLDTHQGFRYACLVVVHEFSRVEAYMPVITAEGAREVLEPHIPALIESWEVTLEQVAQDR